MQPVMLVGCAPLTLLIVALSLNALLSVVTSAKFKAGAANDSVGVDRNATKSSDRNLNHFPNSQSENATMTKKTANRNASLGARHRNDSSSIFNASGADSVPWTDGSIKSSSNKSKKKTNADNEDSKGSSAFWSEDIQVGCRELRARSYITDGYCTSEKPVQEVVCAGHCLPIMDMPWYAEFVKTVAKTKLRDWQCVEDVVRRKRVKLLCRNGTLRHYKIKVVKSCKCKKITNKHNTTTTQKKKRRKDHKGKSVITS